MRLGSLFGEQSQKPLARAPKKPTAKAPAPKTTAADTRSVSAALATITKPGEFNIDWGTRPQQTIKDYTAVLTLEELEAYLQYCQQTGFGSWDYETAPSDETRAHYEPRLAGFQDKIDEYTKIADSFREAGDKDQEKIYMEQVKKFEKEHDDLKKEFLRTPLDPWKGEVCTVSFSAAPNEARVIPISHKVGRNIAPELSREDAREAVFKLMDKYLFTHKETLKIAVNLSFETKYTAKYGRYILGRVADPLIMWVRCMQIVAPGKINNPKKPTSGWGLKPTTKKYLGVQMNDFTKLLEEKGVDFFDEIDASKSEGLVYSAEDSDYGLQQYLYWLPIAQQIEKYDEWLHKYEMPFMRVIGLMEYWGMPWDRQVADKRYEEALEMQAQAAEDIKQIAKESLGLEISVGKTGKTKDVKEVLFKHMNLPVPKRSDKTGDPSLDEEALIDMKFMLENKLEDLDEEKYLTVELPEGWQDMDPDKDPNLSKDERGAIRINKRSDHPYKLPALEMIDRIRKIQKYTTLISSHIVGRQKYLNDISGRIHAGYSTFTETSRLNSFSPNGQNVPRPDNDDFGIRGFYRPKKGKLLFLIDFSGFELRLYAWKSGDEVMIDIFNNDGDIHSRTAVTLTGKESEKDITKVERTNAKAGNFGITYGGTEYALQKTFKTQYGIRKTLEECAAIVKAVKNSYKRIPEAQRQAILDARETGYAETIYGYKRMLKDINSSNSRSRSADERRSGNTPIQGSAADIMKDCQNRVYDEIGRGTLFQRYSQEEVADMIGEEAAKAPVVLQHGTTDMIAQIHDEIIFEFDDDLETVKAAGEWVKNIMEREPVEGFPVPIIAEGSVGYKWSEKVDLEDWLEERGN